MTLTTISAPADLWKRTNKAIDTLGRDRILYVKKPAVGHTLQLTITPDSKTAIMRVEIPGASTHMKLKKGMSLQAMKERATTAYGALIALQRDAFV